MLAVVATWRSCLLTIAEAFLCAISEELEDAELIFPRGCEIAGADLVSLQKLIKRRLEAKEGRMGQSKGSW